MRRSILALMAALALGAGLSGCSEETPGNASAGGETTAEKPSLPEETGSEPSGDDEPSTGSDGGDSPLADLQPCELLKDDQVTKLGLVDGEEITLGGAMVCRYHKEGATAAARYTVQVELYEDQSIDDIGGSTVTPVPKIGGHEAVTFTPPAGGCAISIATSESSRVDATAVGGDEAQACQIVAQVAAAVEPELP